MGRRGGGFEREERKMREGKRKKKKEKWEKGLILGFSF
jgi:hypothetical protein